jgi:hypothetical protein
MPKYSYLVKTKDAKRSKTLKRLLQEETHCKVKKQEVFS